MNETIDNIINILTLVQKTSGGIEAQVITIVKRYVMELKDYILDCEKQHKRSMDIINVREGMIQDLDGKVKLLGDELRGIYAGNVTLRKQREQLQAKLDSQDQLIAGLTDTIEMLSKHIKCLEDTEIY